jgi:hypothetical protein
MVKPLVKIGVKRTPDGPEIREVPMKEKSRNVIRGYRHRFFLNPYVDAAFTKCPKCEQLTRLRKFPLVIFIEPNQFFVLNKQCRYCPDCDLIVARKSQVESLMAQTFGKFRPDVVGNSYQVVGTLDRADWRVRDLALPNPRIVSEKMFVFEDVWNFKLTGGWVPAA